MSTLAIYHFQNTSPIRVIGTRTNPWFALCDLCRILQLEAAYNTKTRLRKNGLKMEAIGSRSSKMWYVNLLNTEKCVKISNTMHARAFRFFILNDVIPNLPDVEEPDEVTAETPASGSPEAPELPGITAVESDTAQNDATNLRHPDMPPSINIAEVVKPVAQESNNKSLLDARADIRSYILPIEDIRLGVRHAQVRFECFGKEKGLSASKELDKVNDLLTLCGHKIREVSEQFCPIPQ